PPRSTLFPYTTLFRSARAEQPHETRQADQVHAVAVQFRRQHAVGYLAIQTFGWQAHGAQPARERRFEAARLRAVGDHHRNLGVQLVLGDVIGDGLEVRSAPGNQDAQALHRYSTRGRPRFRVTTLPMRNGVSPSLLSTASAFTAVRAGTARIIPTPRFKVRR